jgi:hypothetical protein
MIYTKPQILDSCLAHECIKGQDKPIDFDDSNQLGVPGTTGAYEADE